MPGPQRKQPQQSKLAGKAWLGAVAALVVAAIAAALYFSKPSSTNPSTAAVSAPPAPPATPGTVRMPTYGTVDGPRFPKANVVVITIDTLRRDHLAPYGAAFETAAASRLAREGLLFDHAVSQVPLTLPSHTSMFTGLYPPHHTVRDNGGFVLGKDATTLAERFLAHGYHTAGFVSSYVLHSRWGIGQGYETYDDAFDYQGIQDRNLTGVERQGGATVDAALKWLREPGRGQRPFFLWVHLNDPHEPYRPPDEYSRRAPTPYAGEVMYADAQAARLLDALDALNLRRNTVVVYCADHGESLGEHGEPTHGIFLYSATLAVPLIIATPPASSGAAVPLTGQHIKGLARLVDLTPTVLDLVGLGVPPGLDGVSLLPMFVRELRGGAGTGASTPLGADGLDASGALDGPTSYAETYYPRFHLGWSELFAVSTVRWKYVRAPRPELYDLQADPAEQHDVSRQYPRVAATLGAELGAMNVAKAAQPTPAKLDPDAAQRLRSLGYLSGSEGVTRRGALPDPKDEVALLAEMQQAEALRDSGQSEAAIQRLQALVPKDPDNPAVYLALSSVYFREKDLPKAIDAAQRAVALSPDSATSVLTLAYSYQAAGRLDAAVSGFERVLALDSDNLKALLSLGDVYYSKNELEKAFGMYQRATVAAPRFAVAQVNLATLALALNRYDVAEQALRRAAVLGASQPDMHFNLGVIAERRGQTAVATREYEAEVAAYPGAFKAWVNLGLLQRQAGRVDLALASFERAAAANPQGFAGPYLMAETLLAVGRRSDAERWMQETLRRSPNDPRALELQQKMQREASRRRRP